MRFSLATMIRVHCNTRLAEVADWGDPFVWQKRLFVLGALGAPAWVSMLQAP